MEHDEVVRRYDKAAELARDIFLHKLREYGIERYQETDPEVIKWMCYSDVYRKFIRLRQQVRNNDISGLLESFGDLTNYSIQGMQEMSRIKEMTE